VDGLKGVPRRGADHQKIAPAGTLPILGHIGPEAIRVDSGSRASVSSIAARTRADSAVNVKSVPG
jgi:hypothetical protein